MERGVIVPLTINAVAPGIPVAGPEPSLTEQIRALHARMLGVERESQGLDGSEL